MNKLVTILIAAIAVTSLTASTIAYNRSNDNVVVSGISGEKGDKGDKGDVGPRGPQGERGPAGASAPVKLGANPDLQSPYFSFGNVTRWANNVTLTQNASTTCSLQSPAATSTLVSGGIRFATASSSALLVEIGRSSSPNATTTLIGTAYTVGAGAQATIVASSSPAAGDAVVFSPNTYFNVKIGAGSTGSLPVGSCHAVWEVFN
jgi:hypothetical protein